ncbi:MAG: HNH endonuclease, partial [Gammaproteobacteria bacterium]
VKTAAPTPAPELRPDGVEPRSLPPAPVPPPPPAPPRPEPLSPERYKVVFTASKELRDKLERLQALMHEDLAAVIEAAVTEKLDRLESKRFGKTSAPKKSLEEADTSPKSRYIPAPIRRAVYERDGNQCTFVDAHGRRCTERDGLEFHHRQPFGRDGDRSVDNVFLACRAHNAYFAERDYGKEVMDRYRRSASIVRETSPAYSFAKMG